ncbi:hypothetical protein SNE25_09640 [Mucilaginibacter sabulilitoris]|uniref:Uncharacterized protein n=1 Tax=Mucilaginibacter sabulilitoris TaxID=1173583 RepID=A0ABZ0TUM5_9SPHI|nr:hypothetical protein [Mucilaginibacter sabulilitoris]WPU95778.1 hypothetical protein SNE25_09640 [Mucilaginibacter sabulilitoris]
MRNIDPLQSLQQKLTLVSAGHQVMLTPDEAMLYGVSEADQLTEQSIQETEDGE